MSIKTVVIGTLGLGILVTALAIALSFVSEPVECSSFILNVIELRQKMDDPVEKAKHITNIDDTVKQIDNEVISEAWQSMLFCMQEKCIPDDYFNFIMIVNQEKSEELPRSELVSNIIITHRYWGEENIVDFSKALAAANDEIEQMHSKAAADQWAEIVECNGVCAEKDDLFFDMIALVIQA